jgi:hypothetical protein
MEKSLHNQKLFLLPYMTLNILNHFSNKTSGVNNIDIRGRKSIGGTVIYFGVNVQNSI